MLGRQYSILPHLIQFYPAFNISALHPANIMVNYQKLSDQNLVNLFRVTITCQPKLDENDTNELVKELKTLSELTDVN